MDSEGRYAHMVETSPKIQAILMEKFSKDNPHLSSGLKPKIRLQQLYRGSVDPCFLNSKNESESDESLKLEIAIFETSEKCLHFHLIDILNMYKNFDQEWLKKVSEDESSANKIIRIQAVARGFLARKIKSRFLFFAGMKPPLLSPTKNLYGWRCLSRIPSEKYLEER